MAGLSGELYNRCRTTLLKCSEFDTDASLRTVFATNELYPFRGRLPAATSKSERVDACLDYLLEQYLSGGWPVLPLFLAALRDRYQPGDALRDELEKLIAAVQRAFAPSDSPSPEQPSEPLSSAQPSLPSLIDLWDLLSRSPVAWVVIGVAVVVIITALFFQPLRCVLEIRLTEATATLIAALAGGAGMALFMIAPPQTCKALRSFYSGFAGALIIVVLVMKFLPPPLQEDCFGTPVPTLTATSTPTYAMTPTVTETPTHTPLPTPTPVAILSPSESEEVSIRTHTYSQALNVACDH